MILLIDNYDSFTYNLVQRIGELLVAAGRDPDELPMRVVRNDKITVPEAKALAPSHVIVSPGPCTPNEAGVSCDVIGHFAGKVPLFGVCLGHQSIGHHFGMTVTRHTKLMHGKTSPVHHDGRTIFEGLSNPFTATRYHSLVVTTDKGDVTVQLPDGSYAFDTDPEDRTELRIDSSVGAANTVTLSTGDGDIVVYRR